MSTGLPDTTMKYLKKRIEPLSGRERLVSIIIDEVYSAKRVEYSNGKFFGNENESVTKTLLCFMVKGVASTYCDIVAMIPVTTINSSFIKSWFLQVVKAVTSVGFDVVATIVDAHASNRRFYKDELCNGNLTPSIDNPFDSSKKIFLLFDSVHIFKNMYNNLLNKEIFVCPTFQDGGEEISAEMKHVKELYEAEMGQGIKYAHKLTDKVLNPQPIERTNVDLAFRFFHESTMNGLIHFANTFNHPEWKKTASFINLILRFWKAVNVKDPRAVFTKRDPDRLVVSKGCRKQVHFLRHFARWLTEWEKLPRSKTLTKETSFAARQTAVAIADLSEYLIDVKGLSFVLLGYINSDPLEKRFGWFRQLSGANYYASVRQFLEAEKKIRLQCLLKHGQLSLTEVKLTFEQAEQGIEVQQNAKSVLQLLNDDVLEIDSIDKAEAGICYYVAGYISRSLMKVMTCQDCRKLVKGDGETVPITIEDEGSTELEAQQAKKNFLDLVNRGGLIAPSDLMNLVCLYCIALKKLVLDNSGAQKMFLKSASPRSTFVELFLILMRRSEETEDIIDVSCTSSHAFKAYIPKIVSSIFNVFAKNFVSEMNDSLHRDRKRGQKTDQKGQKQRKIAKLQSDC